MRITREIDYAFRIVSFLAIREEEVVGASIIANHEGVTERFALRILRKLNLAGITGSVRGAQGGYYLKMPKEEISLYDIILAVDGPIEINRCLTADGAHCSKHREKGEMANCAFHKRFAYIQKQLIQFFEESKIDDFLR